MNLKEVPAEDLPEEIKPSDKEVPKEDLPTAVSGSEVPAHDIPHEADTLGQQALSAIESAGRGLTGGLSEVVASGMRKGASAIGVPEKYLGYVAPSPETFKEHKETFPVTTTAGELAGNVALMSSLPQIGSKAINGMLQMGMLAGTDELTKSMLGEGDPASAVAARIAEEGAVGLLTGGIFGKVEKLGTKGLAALEKAKLGKKIPSFLAGIGHASTFPEELASKAVPLSKSAFTEAEIKGFDEAAFKQGQKYFNTIAVSIPKNVGRAAAPFLGGHLGGWGGAGASIALERALEHVAPKVSQKYVAPAVLKAMASGHVDNIAHIIDHATKLSKGATKTNKVVEALFKSGEHGLFNFDTSDKEREKLKEYIENGGVDQAIRDENIQHPQGFAEGGKVEVQEPDSVSKVYPEQHVLLSSAKARVSNYLNSVRPIDMAATLPFDRPRKDKHKEREYNKVLDLANRPLSILKHVKNGTLKPKHMAAFTQMYPELYQNLSSKITSELMKNKVKGEKAPPYHVRQAMSLFLGSSLEGSFTPGNIQAAQQVFMRQKAQRAVPKSQSALTKMDDSARTPSQSREMRQNKT